MFVDAGCGIVEVEDEHSRGIILTPAITDGDDLRISGEASGEIGEITGDAKIKERTYSHIPFDLF